MSVFAVSVPRLPDPALNQNRATRAGSHWATYHRAKQQDEQDMMACILSVGRERSMPWDAVAINVHFVLPYVKSAKRRDWDNLIGSCKGFWDGLVKAGVLTDDSIQVVRSVTYTHEYRQGHDSATTFEVTRL